MSDPLATSFDSLVGALAAARTELGAPLDGPEALVLTGRAFRLSIDDHLRVVPPARAEIESALETVGIYGEVASSVAALRDHRGLALIWGTGGEVFGLARLERESLVARSALAREPLRVPFAQLDGAKLVAVLLHGIAATIPLAHDEVAREELAKPAAYKAWARALATHPLSRLDPEGHAWTLARIEQALAAAATFRDDPDLARERALVGELRRLAPLPSGGSLSAESLERGAALLEAAAVTRARWLERLAAR